MLRKQLARWGAIIFACGLYVLLTTPQPGLAQEVQPPNDQLNPQGTTAIVRYVSMSGSDSANLCGASTAPCRTIQHAIEVAQPGDEIRVAQGVYSGEMSVTASFTATVALVKNLSLSGGYSPSFAQRDPAAYLTMIDGQLKPASVIAIYNSTASIDGFLVMNGRAPNGSGIFVFGDPGRLTGAVITNNVIEGNHTIETDEYSGDGAGILIKGDATATIQGNRIAFNVIEDRDGFGAAISVRLGAHAVISGNQVLSNTTLHSTVGGINVYSATVAIISNIFRGNRNVGVDIYDSPSVTIQGNTIISNSTQYEGGGIRIDASTTFTVTDNILSDNRADEYDGGGIYISGKSQGNVEGNTIRGNRAATSGGGIAIYAPGGLISLNSNDISANTSGWGGALAVVSSTMPFVMDGNSVIGNTTTNSNYESGVLFDGVSGSVSLLNNVITRNTNRGVKAVNVPDVRLMNNTLVNNGAIGIEVLGWPTASAIPLNAVVINNVIAGHSDCGVTGFNGALIQASHNAFWRNGSDLCDSAISANSIYADPLFVNAGADDFHLRNGSPAANAGTNAGAPTRDKDGTPRPQAGRVDIGAFESTSGQIYLPTLLQPQLCAGVVSGPAWKFLALIYVATDFRFVDAQGVSRHLVTQLSTPQRELFIRQLTRFAEKDVPALTECGMRPTLTVRVIDRPLTKLTKGGCNNDYVPAPEDVTSDLDAAFDSVFVIWDGSGVDTNSNQQISVEGCAYAFPRGTGQTYLAIGSGFNGPVNDRNVYKHEWGHSITFYFDAAGTAPKPAVNNHINSTDTRYVNCRTGQSYILEDETDDNPIPNSIYNNDSGFTHDYYSGHTATADQPTRCLGITRAAWLTGGPVTKPSGYESQSQTQMALDSPVPHMIP